MVCHQRVVSALIKTNYNKWSSYQYGKVPNIKLVTGSMRKITSFIALYKF